jgi:hypothetical protein
MIHDFNDFNSRMIYENVSSADLDDVIQSELDDMGIEYYTHKGYYSEQSYKEGVAGDIWGTLYETPVYESDRYCYLLLIDINQRHDTPTILPGGGVVLDIGENSIFSCVTNISKVVDTKALIQNGRLCLFLLTDDEIDVNTDELVSLYNDIKHRFRQSKSDYANSTLVSKYDDFIIINSCTYDYTPMKLKRMMKGLDIDGFDVEYDFEYEDSDEIEYQPYKRNMTKISRKK